MWVLYFVITLSLVTSSAAAADTSSSSSSSAFEEIPILSSVQNVERDHVPMAELALFVTRRYISSQTNTVIILKKCIYCSKLRHNFQSRLLEHFLKNFDSLMTLQLFIGRPDDHPWNYNIFIVDSMEAFIVLLFNFPITWHERDFYFLIVLTYTPEILFERNVFMHKIFESCLRFHVQNVVIMLEHRDRDGSRFLFYSYRLFGRKCDEQIDVRLVNIFRRGKLARDLLFPRQLLDLSNCTLRVTAHILPPLMRFRGDPTNPTHLADPYRLSGIDGRLLRILSDVLKFKISLNFPMIKSVIGAYENSTGCFAMLENGEADIAIGGFSLHQPLSFVFTPSIVYHQGPLVFVVRSIGHHFGSIAQLMQPFQPVVWFTIIASMTVGIGVIRFASSTASNRAIQRTFIMGRSNHSPITNLLITFLGYPIVQQPSRNFARFLLMSWMLVTFVLRSAYQAKMYDALRVTRRIPIPRNLEELQQQNYTLLATSKVDYYPHNRTQVVTVDFNERYRILEFWKKKRLVTTSMLDNLMHYNRMQWQELRKSHLTYAEEPIFQYPLVMFFRKHSTLRVPFDKMIKYLMSAGILSHIEKLQVRRKFQNMNSNDLQRASQISSDKLQGLYQICTVLMGVAIVVFLLELLSRRVRLLRRFFLWVNCTD